MPRRTITWMLALSTTVVTGSVLAVLPAHAVSNGSTVPQGTASYLARITTPTKACSAALIDPQWVITSASCLTPDANGVPTENAKVSVGAVDVSTGAGTNAKVVKVVTRTDRDVALAKFDKPAAGIAPVAVSTTAPKTGDTLQLAGFGRTGTEWVPARPSLSAFTVASVNATEAAMTSATGADTCLGDAGGPALREIGDHSELVAVNSRSWQHGCLAVAETREGSTEARVDDLAGWIRQNTVPAPVTCPDGAAIWAARADGTLWRYVHTTPADGGIGWIEPKQAVGSGWNGRMLAGKNGVVWDLHRNNGAGDQYADGALRRWVWNGTSWRGGDEVGNGWERYLTPEYQHRVTVDQAGRIIEINAQGELRVYVWNDVTKSWANPVGDVIDTGWSKFSSITAAGDGVLYAQTPNGNLYRFAYDFGSGKWIQRDKPAGTGWQIFSELFSPGADILYARGADGHSPFDNTVGPVLRWYRYSPNTDSWAPSAPDGAGIPVGAGWNTETHVSAAPDACRYVS